MNSERNKMKSTVLDKMIECRNVAMKNKKHVSYLRVYRMVVSMIPSLNKKPSEVDDNEMFTLLHRFIKQTKEEQEYNKDDILNMDIIVAESFLPKQMSKEEIKEYIVDNIDFTKLKNKFIGIGMVMKKLKNNVDGKKVREVFEEM